MPPNFQVGDLVWAKMTSSFWPGRIVDTTLDAKFRKTLYKVFFFEIGNYRSVPEEEMLLHSDTVLEKYVNYKGRLFQNAIKTIIELSHNTPQCSVLDKSSDEQSVLMKNMDDQCCISVSNSAELFDENIEVPNLDPKIFGYEQATQMKSTDDQVAMSNSDEKSDKDVEELPYLDPENEEFQYGISSNDESFSNVDKNEETSDKIFKSAYENELGPCPSSDLNLPHPKEIHRQIPRMKEPYVDRPKSPPFDFSKSDCLKQRKIKPTNKTIGFLGFTKVAQGIIKNLCHSGHSVIICKEEPDDACSANEKLEECKIFAKKLSIKIMDTPADVLKAADIIFNLVSNHGTQQFFKFIQDTLFEEIKNSRSKKGYVEMTSIPPHMSQYIAFQIKLNGGLYLEAPFCGSRVDAAKGTLYIITAGDKALYEDCKSCFDAISKHHDYMSPENGSALKMNTIYNMFTGTTYAMLGEKMALLETKGLGKDFIEVLKMSECNSSDLVHKAQSMLDQNFKTETSINEMQQHFASGLELAHDVLANIPIVARANEIYKESRNQYGDHDVSAVIQAFKP